MRSLARGCRSHRAESSSESDELSTWKEPSVSAPKAAGGRLARPRTLRMGFSRANCEVTLLSAREPTLTKAMSWPSETLRVMAPSGARPRLPGLSPWTKGSLLRRRSSLPSNSGTLSDLTLSATLNDSQMAFSDSAGARQRLLTQRPDGGTQWAADSAPGRCCHSRLNSANYTSI